MCNHFLATPGPNKTLESIRARAQPDWTRCSAPSTNYTANSWRIGGTQIRLNHQVNDGAGRYFRFEFWWP